MNNLNDFPNEQFSPAEFVDEINYKDLELLEIVGRGAFGTVQRAVWEGRIVAIKIIDMNSGIKEYQDEVEQLSRVRHKNIIRLFGTSINKHKVYIVMEFADCGSLYNLLHPPDSDTDLIPYNLGHVVSWSLQCAEAVEYLHSLQPKVIHRDLKPPNMLLIDNGKIIKICDFGTATQIHTEMTSNKGSAAWMAPEVFEGKRYSEKCDVYSFGIVLWEMLSRKKPFDEIGPPAFRILWAVYNGTRPPPLKGISESLMKLMENCWTKDQSKRPSFSEIVQFFKISETLVSGAEIPIFVDDTDDYYNEDVDSMKECFIGNGINYPSDESPNWQEGNFFPNVELDLEIPQHQRNPNTSLDQMPSLPQPIFPPHISNHNNSVDYSQMSPHSYSSGSSNRTTPHTAFKKSPDWTSPVHGDIATNNQRVNADWNVVPQHLMPIKPISTVPVSVKMYDNYNEALKKYIDLQLKIKNLTIQKENLDGQIKDVNKVQKNNAYYLERYVKLDNEKTTLLEHHRTINSTLENEKAHRISLNRSRSHTPSM